MHIDGGFATWICLIENGFQVHILEQIRNEITVHSVKRNMTKPQNKA